MNPQISGAGDRVGLVLITWALTQAASHGWLSTSDVAVLAPALAILPAMFIGWWKNNAQNIAARAAQLAADPASPIKAIITTNTPEGRTLAKSVPENTIVSAGTPEAAQLAKGS